jgi:hypothetical protein
MITWQTKALVKSSSILHDLHAMRQTIGTQTLGLNRKECVGQVRQGNEILAHVMAMGCAHVDFRKLCDGLFTALWEQHGMLAHPQEYSFVVYLTHPCDNNKLLAVAGLAPDFVIPLASASSPPPPMFIIRDIAVAAPNNGIGSCLLEALKAFTAAQFASDFWNLVVYVAMHAHNAHSLCQFFRRHGFVQAGPDMHDTEYALFDVLGEEMLMWSRTAPVAHDYSSPLPARVCMHFCT